MKYMMTIRELYDLHNFNAEKSIYESRAKLEQARFDEYLRMLVAPKFEFPNAVITDVNLQTGAITYESQQPQPTDKPSESGTPKPDTSGKL